MAKKLKGIIFDVAGSEPALDFQMGINVLNSKNGEYTTLQFFDEEVCDDGRELIGLTKKHLHADFNNALIAFDYFSDGWYKPFTEKNIFEETQKVITFVIQMSELCESKEDFERLKKAYQGKLDREGYIYSKLIFIDSLKELERLATSNDLEAIRALPDFVILENKDEGFIGAIHIASREEMLFEKAIRFDPTTFMNALCRDTGLYFEECEYGYYYNICDCACDITTGYYLSYSDMIENGVFDVKTTKQIINMFAADAEAKEIANLVKKDIIKKLNLDKKWAEEENYRFFYFIREKYDNSNLINSVHLLFQPTEFVSIIKRSNLISEVDFDNLLNYFGQENPYGMREAFKEQMEFKNITPENISEIQKILDDDLSYFYLSEEKHEEIELKIHNFIRANTLMYQWVCNNEPDIFNLTIDEINFQVTNLFYTNYDKNETNYEFLKQNFIGFNEEFLADKNKHDLLVKDVLNKQDLFELIKINITYPICHKIFNCKIEEIEDEFTDCELDVVVDEIVKLNDFYHKKAFGLSSQIEKALEKIVLVESDENTETIAQALNLGKINIIYRNENRIIYLKDY